MTNTICLDEKYSTTRLLAQEKLGIVNISKDKFESVLFLPESENRKGEGGFRTKGYFKKSYEDKPLISIITVVYNGEKYLEETIQSVINQSYDNVEYIIIDGGSIDGTLDIIKKYEEKIDYWVSEKDSGIYDAMNKGIDVSGGEWINFMNAGDQFATNTILSNIFSFLEKNNQKANIIYSDTIFKKNSVYSVRVNNHNTLDLNHQSMVYASNLHKRYGKYVVGKKISISDYIFFNSIKNEKFYKFNEKIAIYDIGGISSDGDAFYRRICVDYIFGSKSYYTLMFSLFVYRPYKIIKNCLHRCFLIK